MAASADGPVNPAPAQMATAVFILREIVALIFVVAWLALFAFDLFNDDIRVPFWFHGLGIAVLAYALGINVAQLTSVQRPRGPVDTVVHRVQEGVGGQGQRSPDRG